MDRIFFYVNTVMYDVLFGQSWFFYLVYTCNARWYDGENAMAQWLNGENMMVRWWNRASMMVKTPCYIAFSPSYHRHLTMVPLHFHDIMFSQSCLHIFTILLSRFHHHTISVSNIVPSCFHYLTITFSPSYHCLFTIILSRFHHCAISFSHRTIAFSPLCHVFR
jgi:hypothetical protein